MSFAAPRFEAGEVRWDGADAFGRWSLVAGARRAAADAAAIDPAIALPLDPGLQRRAIAIDGASGGLALDAMRALGNGERVDFHVSARRAGLLLRDDTGETQGALDARAESRALRSQLGLSLAWSLPGRWGPIPWTRAIAVRAASVTDDARTALDARWSGERAILRREGAAEQRASVEARQAFDLFRGVTFSTGVRLERHRVRALPSDQAPTFADATLLGTRTEIAWRAGEHVHLFSRASRGADDPDASWLVRDPFRGDAPFAIDPLARAWSLESGARMAFGALDVGASTWRIEAPGTLVFSPAGSVSSATAPARHGIAARLGYRVARGLTIDAAAFLDRSVNADGPRLPGAPQVFGSAGATLRMTRDWDAKLRVNYLGPREAIEDAASLKGTTLANFELVRWLGRTTRVSLDVFNVFNQRPGAVDSLAAARSGYVDGTGESFLSSPAEPRAFLLKFRTRF